MADPLLQELERKLAAAEARASRAERELADAKDALDDVYYAVGTSHDLIKQAINEKADRFKRLNKVLRNLARARNMAATVQYDPEQVPEESTRG